MRPGQAVKWHRAYTHAHLFILQTFIECLLGARCCSGHWGHSREQARKKTLPPAESTSMGEIQAVNRYKDIECKVYVLGDRRGLRVMRGGAEVH